MFTYDGVTDTSHNIDDLFSSTTYVGTGSARSVTNGINLSTYGGLVWAKLRAAGQAHVLMDTVRGVSSSNVFSTNSTAAAASSAQHVTAFNSDGFSLGTDATVNTSSSNYVGWTFRKKPKFFDIVTYTGNGSNRTISHSLGATPGMIIVKCINNTGGFFVWNRAYAANTWYTLLNSSASVVVDSTVWNNQAPTSTVFSIGTNAGVNTNTNTYIAYLFAHDTASDGLIQCGGYTGTGNVATAPTTTLGWEPQYVLIKDIDAGNEWLVFDKQRSMDTASGSDRFLDPSGTNTEVAGTYLNVTATGFRPTTTAGQINAVGERYLYMAIRKDLMRIPTDATKVFSISTRTGTGATATISGLGINTGPDLMVTKTRGGSSEWAWTSKFNGIAAQLSSSSTAAETTLTTSVTAWPRLDGVTIGTSTVINTNTSTYVNYFWKQAKGFFDIAGYTGTGAAHNESHNLGVVPEMMIVKRRDAATDWAVYYGDNGKYLLLNSTAANGTSANYWNSTTPTSTTFRVGTDANVNTNTGLYVAYLFATAPGVSKIGTYTGNATTNQINCGFTAGARFVMIKRIDSTGDWYVWDTTRGIIAGNDPYVLMNSTAAEATATDYIDSYSPGFELSSTAPAALNASGGTFLFYAIA